MYQDIEALQLSISRLCKKKGITINKLATISGITQSTLDSIMRGKSKNPKLETLRKIAIGFNMEYDEFISYIRSAQDELYPEELPSDKFTHASGIKIASKLRNLRKQKEVALIDVSNITGARIDYEDKICYMDLSELIALADYFHVSIDYLTGRTDCPDIVTKDKDGRFIAIETMQPPQTAAKEDVDRIANEIIQERQNAFQELSK